MTRSTKQRLNFYTQEFRPAVLPAEIARLQWQLGLTLLVLMVTALGLAGFQERLRGQLVHWQQEQQLAQTELEEEQRRRPPRAESPQLRQQLEEAGQQLERSRQVLNYLAQEPLLASQSFTARVQELGQVPVSGVWLQRFTFSNGGQQIRLEGQLTHPPLLSAYVEALGRQPGYRQLAFRQIDVQRSDNAGLSFVLDSHPAPAAGAASGAAGNTRRGAL